MIDEGEVFAQIDDVAGMVRFLDDPERYDAASVVTRIDAQIQASIAISQRVKHLNKRVRTTTLLLITCMCFIERRSRHECGGFCRRYLRTSNTSARWLAAARSAMGALMTPESLEGMPWHSASMPESHCHSRSSSMLRALQLRWAWKLNPT